MTKRITWVAVRAVALTVACGLLVAVPTPTQAQTRSDSKVKIKATASSPGADGKQSVTVVIDIEKGWHIYSNPVGNEGLEGAETVVKATVDGKPAAIQVTYPKAKLIEDKVVGNYGVYEGTVEIKGVVTRTGAGGNLELQIRLQACDERSKCLLPATVKVPLK